MIPVEVGPTLSAGDSQRLRVTTTCSGNPVSRKPARMSHREYLNGGREHLVADRVREPVQENSADGVDGWLLDEERAGLGAVGDAIDGLVERIEKTMAEAFDSLFVPASRVSSFLFSERGEANALHFAVFSLARRRFCTTDHSSPFGAPFRSPSARRTSSSRQAPSISSGEADSASEPSSSSASAKRSPRLSLSAALRIFFAAAVMTQG